MEYFLLNLMGLFNENSLEIQFTESDSHEL